MEAIWQIIVRLVFYVFSTYLPYSSGLEHSPRYSFLANRDKCDGVCTYCKYSDDKHEWSDIQRKLSWYSYSFPKGSSKAPPLTNEAYTEIGRLINWGWTKDVDYNCMIGIISLRLLSYGTLDPMQFSEDGPDFTVLDFLDDFNTNTAALDLMTSQWAAMLASGWPFFRELSHVRRKLRAHLFESSEPHRWKRIKERPNGCDILDSEQDKEYAEAVRFSLEHGNEPLSLERHLHVLWRGTSCSIGTAVAYLSVALHWIRRGHYQGSLKDLDNHVLQFILHAQSTIAAFAQSKSNWSPYFDMLTTRWPFWEVLSELACVSTDRACVTRSAWQCFDLVQREFLPCPHKAPQAKQTFTACGEHDVCVWPIAEFPKANDWCVPFDQRPAVPRKSWLLEIGHDAEERICSQCGQDGVLQFIFSHIGFRDEAGLRSRGGMPPFFVEFGARKPDMLNSAVLRRFCSWDGVLLDSQPGETPHGGCPGCPGIAELVKTEFVTAENVVALFFKHKVPHDFDLLTIDTDYNDYWIWKALLMNGSFRPRVVAVDFNPDIPLSDAKVVKYEAMAEWDGTVYTVASLLAYALLARAHGYVFAYALEMGSHAFFIRKDLVAEADIDLPLRKVQKASHPPDDKGREFVDVLYDFLPEATNSSRSVATATTSTESLELGRLRHEVRELAEEVRSLRSILPPLAARMSTGSALSASVMEGRSSTPTPKTGAKMFYDSVRHDAL